MTKDTSAVVKRIVDDILLKGEKVEFKWRDVIGGKTYTSVFIGDKHYKLIFSGAKGSLLEKTRSVYEVVTISHQNFLFLFNFCKLYHKLFDDLVITKRE